MALPLTYTEPTFAAFLHGLLGKVALVLGYTAPGADNVGGYGEAINEALAAYGTDTIASVTGQANLIKLRKLGALEAWRMAQRDAAGYVNWSADGQQYSESDLHEAITKNLQGAEREARPYLTDTRGSVPVSRSVRVRTVA